MSKKRTAKLGGAALALVGVLSLSATGAFASTTPGEFAVAAVDGELRTVQGLLPASTGAGPENPGPGGEEPEGPGGGEPEVPEGPGEETPEVPDESTQTYTQNYSVDISGSLGDNWANIDIEYTVFYGHGMTSKVAGSGTVRTNADGDYSIRETYAGTKLGEFDKLYDMRIEMEVAVMSWGNFYTEYNGGGRTGDFKEIASEKRTKSYEVKLAIDPDNQEIYQR